MCRGLVLDASHRGLQIIDRRGSKLANVHIAHLDATQLVEKARVGNFACDPLAGASTFGLGASTTCRSRPENSCHTKRPAPRSASAPSNQGHIDFVDGSGAREGYLVVLVVTSSRMPASLRYLENPEGRAAATSSFCEVSNLAKPRGIEASLTLLVSEDAQDCRSEKT